MQNIYSCEHVNLFQEPRGEGGGDGGEVPTGRNGTKAGSATHQTNWPLFLIQNSFKVIIDAVNEDLLPDPVPLTSSRTQIRIPNIFFY